jgi:hypothetical protein
MRVVKDDQVCAWGIRAGQLDHERKKMLSVVHVSIRAARARASDTIVIAIKCTITSVSGGSCDEYDTPRHNDARHTHHITAYQTTV